MHGVVVVVALRIEKKNNVEIKLTIKFNYVASVFLLVHGVAKKLIRLKWF